MKNVIVISLILLSFTSCIKNNESPAFIKINSWILEVNASDNQGALTHNFSNAWVYVDGELLGVFELPCKVPILKTGSAEIVIFPTIWNNGISKTKKIYPFVESHTSLVSLVGNEITEINPVTRYKVSTQFWIEDFQGSSPKLNAGNPSPASLVVESDPNNSNKYGRVFLNETQNAWAAYTNDELSFSNSKHVYLEVDCLNTNEVVTGLIINSSNGSSENHSNISLPRQSPGEAVWKKVYIDLTELINVSQGIGFLQSFQAVLDNGDSDGLILIDNIKVVYY